MKLEIDVTKEMLNDMVKEYEIISSSCFMRKDEWQDAISQEFLEVILYQYKKLKPKDYLSIKIRKRKRDYEQF